MDSGLAPHLSPTPPPPPPWRTPMRPFARPPRALVLTVVAAATLTACSTGSDEPVVAPTGTHVVDGITFPLLEKTTIRYGLASQGTVGYLPLLVAQEQKL